MPIQQNTALYSLLGVNYGGNGTSNFGLPNLRGQVLMHQGSGPGLTPRDVGESGGSASVTLLTSEIPAHNHLMVAKIAAPNTVVDAGANAYLSLAPSQSAYSAQTDSLVALAPTMLGISGGSGAHENRQPYIVIPFCIALFGIFPSRN